MSRTLKCAKSQRGVGLVMALLTMLVLSVLAAGLLMVTNTEIGTTANYRLVTQARYAAEAGAQSTANWLMSNNPGPTNTTGLDTATYPVQLTANNSAVVLSAISGVSSNYPDSTVQSAFNSALGNQSMPGLTNVLGNGDLVVHDSRGWLRHAVPANLANYLAEQHYRIQ